MSKTPKRFAASHARQLGKAAKLATMYGVGGPGSPVSIMNGNLKKILVRYRQVVPFPLKSSEFFASVLPPELFIDRNADDPRWRNLMHALNVEPVGHFHIEGRDTTHETFWVRSDHQIPAPKDLSVTMTFAARNPYFEQVNDWVTDALKVHDVIDDALGDLAEFINSVQHPVHAKAHWPQIEPFLGHMNADVLNKHVPVIKTRDVALPGRERRDGITSLLATCSLLSDATLNAWVKFPENVE